MADKEVGLTFNLKVKRERSGGFADSVNSEVNKSSKSLTKDIINSGENTQIAMGKKTMDIMRSIMGESLLTAIFAIPTVIQQLVRSMVVMIPLVLGVLFGATFMSWIQKKISKPETMGSDTMAEDIYYGKIASTTPLTSNVGFGEDLVDNTNSSSGNSSNTTNVSIPGEIKISTDVTTKEDTSTITEFGKELADPDKLGKEEPETFGDGISSLGVETEDPIMKSIQDMINNPTNNQNEDFIGNRSGNPFQGGTRTDMGDTTNLFSGSGSTMSEDIKKTSETVEKLNAAASTSKEPEDNEINMKLTLDSKNFQDAMSAIKADESITEPIKKFNTALTESVSMEISEVGKLTAKNGPYEALKTVLGDIVKKMDTIKGLKSDLANEETKANTNTNVVQQSTPRGQYGTINQNGTAAGPVIQQPANAGNQNLSTSPLLTIRGGNTATLLIDQSRFDSNGRLVSNY